MTVFWIRAANGPIMCNQNVSGAEPRLYKKLFRSLLSFFGFEYNVNSGHVMVHYYLRIFNPNNCNNWM